LRSYQPVFDMYEVGTLHAEACRDFPGFLYVFMPTRHDDYFWGLGVRRRGILTEPTLTWCSDRFDDSTYATKGDWIFIRDAVSAMEFRLRWC
jgi:hypothetical protein